jgi:serine/threonine protein kinase
MEVRRFGKYQLLDHMGRGGVANVYRACNSEDGSIVAVKVFSPDQDRPPETTRKLRDREVRMLVSVQHPNVVRFHEAGELGDECYYAMEFVEDSLLKRMREGNAFDLVDKVLILRQTASALAAIHHQGIVHRDIKPGNILLDQDPDGRLHVKLTDLGIAKNVSETDVAREPMDTRVPGTLKYLSPEQIKLQAVDGRSDVFSLGVVAYELFTDSPPFTAETTEEYLAANREQFQVPAHEMNQEIPAYLGGMIEKMLAKDREDRYDSDTLLRDLELVLQHVVRGAPMVERTNPASMFYVPPEERPLEPAYKVAPVSWALALAIALVGLLFSVAFWPSVGTAQTSAPPLPPPGTEALLQRAEEASRAGRHWQVLDVALALDSRELTPGQRARLAKASARARQALAERSLSTGETMLGQGRIEEAEIVLQSMRELLPGAAPTRQLEAAVEERRQPAARTTEWQAILRETNALMRRGRHREALEVRRELVASAPAGSARRAEARRALGELFDHWAEHLLRERGAAEEIESYLALAASERDLPSGMPSGERLGRLRLKLGGLHRDAGHYEAALAQYELALEDAGGELREEARSQRENLRRYLAERPLEMAELSAALKRAGFKWRLWEELNAAGGSQRVTDGALRLHVAARGDSGRAERETMQPVRNRGFGAAVELKAGPGLLARPGDARAGLRVADLDGRVFSIHFDGGAYGMSRGHPSSPGSSTIKLRDPLGDESAAGHVLGLRYEFNTGYILALIDGEELDRYQMALGDFRLGVFLEAQAGVAASAEFRDISCTP